MSKKTNLKTKFEAKFKRKGPRAFVKVKIDHFLPELTKF